MGIQAKNKFMGNSHLDRNKINENFNDLSGFP